MRRERLALALAATTAILLAATTADARRLAGSGATPNAATTPTPKAADPQPDFPRTRNVYVEVKVAHAAPYMALEGRADKLARLVKEAAAVKPGARMAVAAVDGSPPGGSNGQPPSLTYGAVVFNDEDGAAEREVAAVAAPGALEKVAAGAKAFGVAVTDLAARFGTRRRRAMMMVTATR